MKEEGKQWLYQGIVIAVLLLVVLTFFSPYISELFAGVGLEVIYALGYFGLYVILLCFTYLQYNYGQKKALSVIATCSIVLVLTLNTTSFSWYFLNYINQSKAIDSLLLGLTLGAGIGFSFAILLYFFLDWCREYLYINTSLIFLSLFAAGQLTQGVKLLSQVDLWPVTPLVFNIVSLIPEQSVLAQLLSVLLGNHVRMTQLDAAVYFIALLLPMILLIRSKHEA